METASLIEFAGDWNYWRSKFQFRKFNEYLSSCGVVEGEEKWHWMDKIKEWKRIKE